MHTLNTITHHTPHHPHLLTPSQVNHINLAADNPLEFARCLLSAAQTVTLSIKRQVSNHVLYICLFSLSHRYQRVAGLKGGERGGERKGGGRGGVEGGMKVWEGEGLREGEGERGGEGRRGGGRGTINFHLVAKSILLPWQHYPTHNTV